MGTRKKSYDTLPEIPFGKRPKILLVGNGINLSFSGAAKTDKIIRDEWDKNYDEKLPEEGDSEKHHPLWDIPFPWQIVVSTKDHVQGCMSGLASAFKVLEVSEEQKKFIKDILNARFDAILSTNYSLEFEKSTISGYSEHKVYSCYRITVEQTTQQKQFGIFQCTELQDLNHSLLWHIHGTALRKNSLVMGQMYYGKLLSEITGRANKVNSEYQATLKQQIPFHPKSWIDYFLIGDVYIFGFKLVFPETDIWWLLSYKKSAFPQSSTFFYNTEIDEEKKLMFKCYNVNTPVVDFDGDYIEYYRRICNSI